MGIDDRDYMRGRHRISAARPWWQTITRYNLQTIAATVTAIVAIVSGGLWIYHRVRSEVSISSPSEGSLRVNINSATAAELETIPGIGPALAQLIVSQRPYTTVDDLVKVRGIGPKQIDSLRPFVSVDELTRKRIPQ